MARDARAFEELYEEHEPALFRYLARRLGPTKAEDAVAAAFAAAWHAYPDLDGRVAVRTWLLGLAVEHLRRCRQDELAYLDGAHTDRPSAVATALAELDPIDRDMLTLRVWADLSDEGIAAVTCVPVEAVQRRVRAAHDHVRRRVTASVPRGDIAGNRPPHSGNHP